MRVKQGIRSLSKLSCGREVHSVFIEDKNTYLSPTANDEAFLKQEGYELGAEDRNVLNIRNDLSTKLMPQFSAEVEFNKKRSIHTAFVSSIILAGIFLTPLPSSFAASDPKSEPKDNPSDPPTAATAAYIKACNAYGAGYFHIPGSEVCLKVGGLVRFEGRWQSVSDMYKYGENNDLITTFGSERPASGFRALGAIDLDARTNTTYGLLRSYAQFRFQQDAGIYAGDAYFKSGHKSQVSLFQGFIQFAGLTAGHTQSMFDFYGGAYGYDDVRGGNTITNLAAYTMNFGGGVSATLSAESPSHHFSGMGKGNGIAEVKRAGVKYPDLVAALRLDQGWGAAQLSAALHQQNVMYKNPEPGPNLVFKAEDPGYALQGGVKFNLPFSQGSELWLQAAYAKGALDYQHVGAGYGRNAFENGWTGLEEGEVIVAKGLDNKIVSASPTSWSLLAAIKHQWNPSFSSSLRTSYLSVDYPEYIRKLSPTSDWRELRVGLINEWTPTPGFVLGLEVLYVRLDQQPVDKSLNFAQPIAGKPIPAWQDTANDGFQARLRLQRNF